MKKEKIIKTIIFILMAIVVGILVMIGTLLYEDSSSENNIVEQNEVQNYSQNNNTQNNEANESSNNTETGIIEEEEEPPEFEYNKIIEVDNPTYFYTVKDCLNTYFNNLDYIDDKEKGDNYKRVIYDQLSDNYKEKNKIEKENVSEYVKKHTNLEFVRVNKMLQYMIEKNNVIRFFVCGIFKNKEGKMYYDNYIVYMDYTNATFSIEPTNKKTEEIREEDLSTNINEIKKNNVNQYTYTVKTSIDYTK